MNKVNMTAAIAVFLLLAPAATAQSVNTTAPAQASGILPGSPLYPVESFAENLEVKLAGVIGGPDLKAKALANNADERLSEARTLAERNRSDKAVEMINEYEKTMNKSFQAAGVRNDSRLAEKLDNVSRNNVKALEDVRDRVPPQAREGIERAIERSNRSSFGGPPAGLPGKGDARGNSGNLTPGKTGELPAGEAQREVPANRTVPGMDGLKRNTPETPGRENMTPGNGENFTAGENVSGPEASGNVSRNLTGQDGGSVAPENSSPGETVSDNGSDPVTGSNGDGGSTGDDSGTGNPETGGSLPGTGIS